MFATLRMCGALFPQTRPGYFCEQKTASATQPQACPVGTYYDSTAATSAQSCSRCPNPDDCKDAGKTAPDCEPTVFRPSTFWCYDAKQQALIILGAVASCITSLWGGVALYNKYKLGSERLSRLRVDLARLALPIRVLASVFLVDKMIKLHKLRRAITLKTLWRSLPFDEEQDADLGDLIADRIERLISELEQRGKPLDLNNLADVIRSSQGSDRQSRAAEARVGQNLHRRRHSSSTTSQDDGAHAENPADPSTSCDVRTVSKDASHPQRSVVTSQTSHDIGAAPLNEVVVQPQHERSRPPPLGPRVELSKLPPSEPHASDTSGPPSSHARSSETASVARSAAVVKLPRSIASVIPSMRASNAATPPLSTAKDGPAFVHPTLSNSSASQAQACDTTLDLDIISPTGRPHGEPDAPRQNAALDAASASALASPPHVHSPQSHHLAPPPATSRAIHRQPTSDVGTSALRPSSLQPSASAAHAHAASPSTAPVPHSTAHTTRSTQGSIPPSPPRSRSKSRGRATAATVDAPPDVPADAAAPLSTAANASASAAFAARQREGARANKRSSLKPKNSSPPPLTVTHRLRIMGAEFEEC